MSLKNKRILIFQQRNWGKIIGRFIAKKLYKEGARLAALTFKKSVHELIENQPEVKYDLIINNDDIMSRPKDYTKGEIIPMSQICTDLGIDSIWPIVYTLRNHVKSYKQKYYYGFRQNVSDEEILDFVQAVYKYIKVFFKEFKPDVIIAANFVSLPHIMMNLYAKKQGVPMIAITDSKIQNQYIFTYDYIDSSGPFYNRVQELDDGLKSENAEKAKKYIKEFRQKFKTPDYAKKSKEISLWKKIKKEIMPFYQIYLWYRDPQVNVLESTGITIDYRPPRIILRDYFSEKSYRRAMNNYKYYPFERIGKFIYFPLQFQPEATIDVMAPYFSNQIETARLVAMSLPDDFTLLVKEHPEMVGKRPPSYIEKLDKTVNIKLVDYRTPQSEILKRTSLVISPNSTTIAEASFYNVPAIQLGNLGTTLLLPNVRKHTDMTTLPQKIKEVLKINLKTEEYERKLENFVAAAFDASIKADYIGIWENGKTELLEELWKAYKMELERVLQHE